MEISIIALAVLFVACQIICILFVRSKKKLIPVLLVCIMWLIMVIAMVEDNIYLVIFSPGIYSTIRNITQECKENR